MMWIHFTATATTFVLCCHCFVQGFSVIGHYQRPHFADSNLRTKGGVGVAGRYTSSSRRVTTEQQPSIARESKAATRGGGSSGASTVGGNKMVLRPDWEREGRVFGLSPQSLQDTQRAARLAEGLLKQKQEAKGKPAERAFEYLVSYPCEFEIKVIGINEGSFADDIAATVSSACQVEARDVRYTVRDTNSGKYQSVTVQAPVKNAKMLYRCYELIAEDPRVKFKF